MDRVRETALRRLRELREEANTIDYSWEPSERLKEWRLEVNAALTRLFGGDSPYLEQIQRNHWGPLAITPGMPKSEWEKAFLRALSKAKAIMSAAIREIEDYEMNEDDDQQMPTERATSKRSAVAPKVFIVHGHDNEMKESVARFLERLDVEAIILHEQPSRGSTVIEKIENNSDVAYAVVLLSPDDVGKLATDAGELEPRARQNVVLELGYFVGRLGRDRVCAVLRSHLELPSDALGVVYIPFEGEWKLHIIRELKALGLDIDANKAF